MKSKVGWAPRCLGHLEPETRHVSQIGGGFLEGTTQGGFRSEENRSRALEGLFATCCAFCSGPALKGRTGTERVTQVEMVNLSCFQVMAYNF